MTLTLAPTTGTRLLALAERRGRTPEAVIDAFVARETADPEAEPAATPLTTYPDPMLALFAQWAEEDRTDDLEEIARRQRDGDKLLARLQENRLFLRHEDVSSGERG